MGKKEMHHRGEHNCGTVKGWNNLDEDVYVPRASWTETLGSPLKQRNHEMQPEDLLEEARRDEEHKNVFKRYLQKQIAKQVQEKERRGMKTAGKNATDPMRASTGSMPDKETLEKEERERIKKVFREGLDEQAAFNAKRTQEIRLREAYEAAEIKLRTTQQLCQELAEANRKKEAERKHWADLMRDAEDSKAVRRAEKQKEDALLRQSMRSQLNNEEDRLFAQQERIRLAMEQQEAKYKVFEAQAGKLEGERLAREARRQERDEKHHMLRTDLMYAQREMARERQAQRMRRELDQQLASRAQNRRDNLSVQESERDAVDESTRRSLEADAERVRIKRAEELENQAALVAQMHERQLRDKREAGPNRRLPPALNTMEMTPGLLAAAESWRTAGGATSSTSRAPGGGGKGGHPRAELPHQLEAARHLEKPMGQPEVKPWVDIAKSLGPGGLVGVFGADGPTRSTLMATGGPGRILARSLEMAAKDRKLNTPWHEGVSPADLQMGRKAAAKRKEASAADKALT